MLCLFLEILVSVRGCFYAAHIGGSMQAVPRSRSTDSGAAAVMNKGAWSRLRDLLFSFWTSSVTFERVKLDTSFFLCYIDPVEC